MNKRKETKEFNRRLSDRNMKRAIKSSRIMAIVIPVILAAGCLSRWDNQSLKIFFIIGSVFFEIVQIIYAVILKVQYIKDEFDIFPKLYLSYYAVTIVFMMLGAGCDIEGFGSELFYFAACMYLVFVPILNNMERLFFVAGQTVIMLSMLLGFRINLRCLIDVCIIQIGTIIVSGYQHGMAVRIQRMSMKLKRKTDTSEHDALTGLFNRRGLESRIEAIWPFCERNKIPVGVLALDIDYFKKYNDALGHPQGDECLRQVAGVLRNSAQRSTDIVTRTGGEEFLIFVQDIDDEKLVSLAMKIRNNLEEKAIPQAYFGVSRFVTVSIGVASFIPSYNRNFKKLYEEADKALYQAKQNGRNCIVYKGSVYGRIRNGATKVSTV